MSYRSTQGIVPAWAILFPAKDKASGMEIQGCLFCILFAQFLLWLWSASAPLVWSEMAAASLLRGEGRRAGVHCKTNLLKALAPKFTSADAEKH